MREISRHTPGKGVSGLLLLLALGGLALAGCRKGGDSGGQAPVKGTDASVKQAIQISVTKAVTRSMTDTADITGALNTLDDVTVGVKSAGKLVAVYVREGDAVKAGQIVAQQDLTDLQQQLAQQQANVESARTKLTQAQVAYKSAQTNLTWTDAQTKAAIQQARAGVRSAQDSLTILKKGARDQERNQAQQNVDSAQADLDSAKVDQDHAVRDLKRYEDLVKGGAISDQQLDQARATKLAADARVDSLTAKLAATKQALSLTLEGSRPEEISRAQAAVDQAQDILTTAISNRDQVAMRRSDVDNARAGIASAQAGVDQAVAQLRLAEQAIRDASIRSPIDGVVAERKAEPGTQIAVTKPDILRIVALNAIYFDGQLPESQYAEVRVGQAVAVTVDAVPGRTFQGHVNKIYPVASSARSFTVRITLTNEGKQLRPQMFARGRITLATHLHAIVVPRDAVLEPQEKEGVRTGYVFVVENDKAHKRDVTLGFSDFSYVEVTHGLLSGDAVVTVGQAQLADGDSVNIQSANPTTTASSQ